MSSTLCSACPAPWPCCSQCHSKASAIATQSAASPQEGGRHFCGGAAATCQAVAGQGGGHDVQVALRVFPPAHEGVRNRSYMLSPCSCRERRRRAVQGSFAAARPICTPRLWPAARFKQGKQLQQQQQPCQAQNSTAQVGSAHHSITPSPTTSTVAGDAPAARLAAAASAFTSASSVADVAPARPRTTKRVCPAPSLRSREAQDGHIQDGHIFGTADQQPRAVGCCSSGALQATASHLKAVAQALRGAVTTPPT